MRGVRVEVLLWQAHFVQVCARSAVQHDRVGWREMIGRDVVAEHGERTQAAHRALASESAFPIGWPTNVGALGAPFVERICLRPGVCDDCEHRLVDFTELLGLYARGNDCINFRISRPNVFQRDGLAGCVEAERVLFDVKTNRARNRVRDHQRRRRKERLLRVRVNSTIKIAIAREYGRRVEVAVNRLFLNHGIKRARHTVARRAGEAYDAKSKLLKLGQKPCFVQVQLNGF